MILLTRVLKVVCLFVSCEVYACLVVVAFVEGKGHISVELLTEFIFKSRPDFGKK
jgi:hypothetical protein